VDRSGRPQRLRLGTDIGGTFTEFVRENRPWPTFLLSISLAILKIQHIIDALRIISSHFNRSTWSILRDNMAFFGHM